MARARRLPFLVSIGQTIKMLTISPPPELEEQLRVEAQKRGVAAEELTVEALRMFLKSNGVTGEAETKRLAAIDRFIGMASDLAPLRLSEEVRRDRDADLARDERDFQAHLEQRE